ncbi:MAG: PGF-CTERM-anchored ABC transporter substrate-binding protein [Halobacteria archaeon]
MGLTDRECSFPVNRTDATRKQVSLSAQPKRIVTLNPSAAQILWDIGAKSSVVGVSKYASYLDGAGSKTNVTASGDSYVSDEKVVSLKPDLVLAPNTMPNQTVESLRVKNLTVYRYRDAETLDDVENQTVLTGTLSGECRGAEEEVSRMRSELETVRSKVSDRGKPKVLYVFSGYTSGKNTFIDHVIESAGGRNAAAMAGISGYKKISKEEVIKQDPRWILRNTESSVPENRAYNNTYAVKHGNVVVVNDNYISEPAPRILQPIEKLARNLHPEQFGTENLTSAPTEGVNDSGDVNIPGLSGDGNSTENLETNRNTSVAEGRGTINGGQNNVTEPGANNSSSHKFESSNQEHGTSSQEPGSSKSRSSNKDSVSQDNSSESDSRNQPGFVPTEVLTAVISSVAVSSVIRRGGGD